MSQTPENIPYNADAERSLLGAILLSNGALYPDAASVLSADDFFSVSNRRIFLRMGELSVHSQPVDLVTLCEILMNHEELEYVGGAGFLSRLTDGLPRLTNLDHYCKIIREKSELRKVLAVAESVSRKAFRPGAHPEEVSAEGQRLLSEIGASRGSGLVMFSELFKAQFKSVDSVVSPRSDQGILTGYTAIDRLTLGLHRGELTLLAARPSLGKTSLALNIAAKVARDSGPVAIFSLEMTKEALVMRLICAEARVNWQSWAGGFLGQEEKVRMIQAAGALAHLPMAIDDDGSVRPETIMARAKRMKSSVGQLSLAVVDYVQLVAGGKHESRVQEMSYVSRSLKGMAKDLDCPVLACCQLNRSPEDRGGKPRLSDLRDTGQLEQDADVVIFLWKDNPAQGSGKASRILSGDFKDERLRDKTVDCAIEKQRNGPTGDFKLVFLREYCRFENADSFEEVGKE